MQEINRLQQEIESFEAEIAKLKGELATVGGLTLKLASGETSASSIATEVRQEAQKIIERQPVLTGIKNAIIELTNRLNEKQIQLEELEKQQLKRQRSQRVEEGRSRLQSKVAEIEAVGQSLKNLFLELKVIGNQYKEDFAELNPPTPSRQMLNTASLLNFGLLTIPTLTENDGRFLLSSQTFDVFEAEKVALQKQRQEASRRSQQNQDDMMAQIRQREADEKLRTEREYKASLLITKRQDLKDFKSARGDRLAALRSADVGYFDSAIASLEAEILSLQEPQG